MRKISYLVLLLFAVGCAQRAVVKTQDDPLLKEDLSVYRTDYEKILKEEKEAANDSVSTRRSIKKVKPIYDITEELDQVLTEIAQARKEIGFVEGFTVLVYNGVDREKAYKARDLLYRAMPDEKARLAFVQPNYKVKVGRFYSKLEAYEIQQRLKQEFPTAIIIPEKIKIN